MIYHPLLLLGALILLVVILRRGSAHPTFGRLFKWLPLPFWCYVVPMLATTAGWLPAQHPLYSLLSKQLLPVCLVLLLIGTDLRGLIRLGPLATTLMLAGSLGTILGGLVSYTLYRRWLPNESWGGIGALAASWIGGSANLLAVKEALHVPDPLIGPIVIVDALIAYSWMAFLIWSSGLQHWWEQWIQSAKHRKATGSGVGCAGRLSDPASPTALFESPRSPTPKQAGCGDRARCFQMPAHPLLSRGLAVGTLLSLVISGLAQWAAHQLPTIGQVISPETWTVLLVTTVALALSSTSLSRLEEAGISKVGTFALYLLLTSIGARANLTAVTKAPIFLALGITWILIHGLCLILVGRFLKAPLGLIATASQANIGGPISAPIVGATYHPSLAGAGLLMAILGNILGTYLGLLTAFVAHFL